MRAFDSSLGRLVVAVLTAAIGLETMRSQSEFWLGVLAALTAAWVIHALATAVAERGPRRAFCLAFAGSTVASLAVGFGPWSDIAIRGDLADPQPGLGSVAVLPTTRALLEFANRQVHPTGRGTILMLDRSGRPYIETVLTSRSAPTRDLHSLAEELDVATRVHMGVVSVMRPGFPNRSVARHGTLDIYFHAAYLLLSLAFGALAACFVLLVRRVPRDRRGRGIAPPRAGRVSPTIEV